MDDLLASSQASVRMLGARDGTTTVDNHGEDDAELAAIITRCLQPPSRHLKLLHADFLSLNSKGQNSFLGELSEDARTVSDHDLDALRNSEWRSNLTAAYLIARSKPAPSIGKNLGQKPVASRLLHDRSAR